MVSYPVVVFRTGARLVPRYPSGPSNLFDIHRSANPMANLQHWVGRGVLETLLSLWPCIVEICHCSTPALHMLDKYEHLLRLPNCSLELVAFFGLYVKVFPTSYYALQQLTIKNHLSHNGRFLFDYPRTTIYCNS
ncbi:hypothetical protein AVEN_257240-1 [Araneus ventricosus]|uniref:Uncharacterized protein n=1 Tax=Araneus ventricosus TaxID=182803 RepID=A0A4Y2L7I9_ARAVE|nr:hypothetical protein AVEN_257240-1 [Araneus ventricosus]